MGERLNGIQEVDGSTPFSSTFLAEGNEMVRLDAMIPPRYVFSLVVLVLCGNLALASGCATRQRYPTTAETEESIERPARSLDEEETLADRIGQVGVVILVVGITVGLILIPILLF